MIFFVIGDFLKIVSKYSIFQTDCARGGGNEKFEKVYFLPKMSSS